MRTPDCLEGEIVHTGLRPGEKLVEQLIRSEDAAIGTAYPRILKASEPMTNLVKLRREFEALRAAIATRQTSLALAILASLVEENSLREAWKAIEPEPPAFADDCCCRAALSAPLGYLSCHARATTALPRSVGRTGRSGNWRPNLRT